MAERPEKKPNPAELVRQAQTAAQAVLNEELPQDVVDQLKEAGFFASRDKREQRIEFKDLMKELRQLLQTLHEFKDHTTDDNRKMMEEFVQALAPATRLYAIIEKAADGTPLARMSTAEQDAMSGGRYELAGRALVAGALIGSRLMSRVMENPLAAGWVKNYHDAVASDTKTVEKLGREQYRKGRVDLQKMELSDLEKQQGEQARQEVRAQYPDKSDAEIADLRLKKLAHDFADWKTHKIRHAASLFSGAAIVFEAWYREDVTNVLNLIGQQQRGRGAGGGRGA